MINTIQEKIYNDYLKALGSIKGRGYKQRKNFSNMDDKTLMVLYRLEIFFSEHSHINPYDFFLAALKYKNVDFLPIEAYLKHGAVVAYLRINGEANNL